jgi:hypothetical protein
MSATAQSHGLATGPAILASRGGMLGALSDWLWRNGRTCSP